MPILTLDIGGSSIKYSLIDDKYKISNKGKVLTPRDSKEELYESIKSIWEQHSKEAEGIAISMPGVIDSNKGIAYSGGVLDYIKNCEIAKEISELLNTKVLIANDAKCAGTAELGSGSLQDVDDGIVLVFGTGIGGCIIKDKKIFEGKHFSAGEVSNMILGVVGVKKPEEKVWAMRNGIAGLASTVKKHYGEHNLTGIDIFNLAKSGDEKIMIALEEFADGIAEGIFTLQAAFDVEKVAIGGGISEQPILIDLINKCYDKIQDSITNCKIYRPQIVACKFYNDANLIGAYYKFRQMYNM